MKKFLALLLSLFLLFSVLGCGMQIGYGSHDADNEVIILPVEEKEESSVPDGEDLADEALSSILDEDGLYDSKEDVALYLHTFEHLPDNYITKKVAESLGWHGGSLEPYAPGCCIGGSHFGNYEGILPDGHNYKECDINTMGAKSRGAERIIYSDDGLIFYTEDHYGSFTLLYGEVEGWN